MNNSRKTLLLLILVLSVFIGYGKEIRRLQSEARNLAQFYKGQTQLNI